MKTGYNLFRLILIVHDAYRSVGWGRFCFSKIVSLKSCSLKCFDKNRNPKIVFTKSPENLKTGLVLDFYKTRLGGLIDIYIVHCQGSLSHQAYVPLENRLIHP